jgi:hypothetical protein
MCKWHRENPLTTEPADQEADVNDARVGPVVAVSSHTYPVAGSAAAWSAPLGIKDSGERVTYASGSMRDPSTGKIKWSRITFGPMMRRWATHLTNAEVKYPDPLPGVPNFTLIETDEEYQRYKESAFRHFMSWFHDEMDEDHASAVFFNINGVEIIKDKNKAK